MRKTVLIFSSIVLLIASLALSQSIEPTDSWVYESLDLLHHYQQPEYFENQRPYWRDEALDDVGGDGTGDGYIIDGVMRVILGNSVARWEYKRVASELAYIRDFSRAPGSNMLRFKVSPYSLNHFEDKREPLYRIGFKAEGLVNFSSNIFIQLRGRIENKGHLDSFAKVRRWEDKITGYFDYALLGWEYHDFRFTFGRTFRAWGPEDNDRLMLSTNSPAFNQFSAEYSRRWLAFQFWAAQLDPFFDAEGDKLNRFFSVHRLAIKPYKRLEIGLSETVLYARENAGWDLSYLIPILPFYWEQYNNRIDDNIYWDIDFTWYPVDGLKLYGEWLIDDFQIDFVSEPHQIGFNLGVSELGLLFSQYLQLEFDYTQIRNTVYGQNKFYNVYTHEGVIIGSSLGTDSDRLRYAATYHANPFLRISAGGEYRRKGEGRYNTGEYPAPKGQKFPSGIVEEEWDNYLRLDILKGTTIEGQVTAGYKSIENLDNIEGNCLDSPYLSVNILYHFKRAFLF
ncbi:MAG TPA: hypothetical protein ENO22_07580 [candidate division Zixibacteria bacterium]|nr:hypothetical protein [candidate division Zixibacteria bacterium]